MDVGRIIIGGVSIKPKQGSHGLWPTLNEIAADENARRVISRAFLFMPQGVQAIVGIPLGERQVAAMNGRLEGNIYTVFDVNIGDQIVEQAPRYGVDRPPKFDEDVEDLPRGVSKADVDSVIARLAQGNLAGVEELKMFSSPTYGKCYLIRLKSRFKIIFSIKQGCDEIFLWGIVDGKYEKIKRRIF